VRAPAAHTIGRRLPFAGIAGGLFARAFSAGASRIAERLDEMREVLRAADVLIAPSRFLRDRMVSLGAPDIHVLPNGHEDLPMPPRRPDPDGRLRVGFVGAAIPSKGVHVLAEAFRLLADPRVALRIHGPFVPYHGDTGYEARVRSILGPHAGQALRGSFPHDELGRVLAGLDVLAVPSLWEENAPLTVEEAFLARVPVVVSDHGGLAERVSDGRGGLRFRPGDAADLARVVRRFLDEPGLRDELAAAAPRVPTMDEHVAAIEGLYQAALRRRRGRCGRVGVVVLDRGRPAAAAAAARSALDGDVSPRVVIVENGPGPESTPPAGASLLRLDPNRGFGGGMNAGIAELRRLGCERVLLLNNDATLEPGALRRLAEALEDPGLAAVGPVILRESDGRIESQGGRFDPRWGWHRLAGHGASPPAREGRLAVDTLSGAVLMVSVAALDRVGRLDEDYFLGFEDTEWCVRARRAGLGLAVVLGARARHVGSGTLGPASPERLYYAARNHLRAADRLAPPRAPARWLREWVILALNLAHALRQRQVPRMDGVRAVAAGFRDFRRRRFGPRRP
jgi:GT2 family glycosyltransferase